MKLTGSQGSESVLENYLNCNQDELCQVTSLKGERINIYVTYINTRTDTYVDKFHSYTNPLNVICLQLQATKTPTLPSIHKALDTLIQDSETKPVVRCIDGTAL